jgi:PD-(D/E)XK nuclease superfamily protein
MLTTDQKGNVAELAIARDALTLGIDVYRPLGEGGRCDLIFEIDERLSRVQCKWAPRQRDVIVVRCYSTRRNRAGLVRRACTDAEIDAFAAYCPDTERCYFLPFSAFRPRSEIFLRLAPCKNSQKQRINWARDYEFAATLGPRGAIAQLGERLHGMQEVAGSSPAGSTDRLHLIR